MSRMNTKHTQVYFGVARFSWSFILLENMSCFLGEVEDRKSHSRSVEVPRDEPAE